METVKVIGLSLITFALATPVVLHIIYRLKRNRIKQEYYVLKAQVDIALNNLELSNEDLDAIEKVIENLNIINSIYNFE